MPGVAAFRISPRVVALALCLPFVAAASQRSGAPVVTPHPSAEPIVAARANETIRVDGRLDEPIWDVVTPTTHFIQLDPVQGELATLVTDVRMIITDSAVVIGARLHDDQRKPASALRLPTDDDAASGYLDDYFEVQIDPHREHVSALALAIEPNGGRRASMVARDGTRDESWVVQWDASTVVDDKGWTVEIKVPLSEFHVAPGTESWGVQFVRFSWRCQETDVFRNTSVTTARLGSRTPNNK